MKIKKSESFEEKEAGKIENFFSFLNLQFSQKQALNGKKINFQRRKKILSKIDKVLIFRTKINILK
jgi:hypothetical protein